MRPTPLFRFSQATLCCAFLLLCLGAAVTSLDAGLSVPDWPNTFGWNLFAFPIVLWRGDVFWEHTHRLAATGVGALTAGLLFWILRAEPRRWVRGVACGAGGLVLLQALMGGLRVTERSTALAFAHGCAGQAFLCLLLLLTLALSPRWEAQECPKTGAALAWAFVVALFLQLGLGAAIRHLQAGLAIPTFPLTPDGRLFPSDYNLYTALAFGHRLWGLFVLVLAAVLFTKAERLWQPASAVMVLLLFQIYLGAEVIWQHRAPTTTTLHVANGAATLLCAVTLAVRWRRPKRAPRKEARVLVLQA